MWIRNLLVVGIGTFLVGPADAGGDLHSDSLAAKEIFRAMNVGMREWSIRNDGKLITKITIYYQSGDGPMPSALGLLDGLRVLRIHICGVSSLPREIGNLKILDTLDVMATDVGPTLPEEIGSLSNLKYLRVSSSKLVSLPASLRELKGVQYLNFQGNEICKVDAATQAWIKSIAPNALEGQRNLYCDPTPVRSWKPEKAPVPCGEVLFRWDGRKTRKAIRSNRAFHSKGQ